MASASQQNKQVTLITPPGGWEAVDFKELKAYQDLFYFLVWRDIKVLYAQTVMGFAWAVLNPMVQIIIFSIIFGKVAKLPTDGIPYAVIFHGSDYSLDIYVRIYVRIKSESCEWAVDAG